MLGEAPLPLNPEQLDPRLSRFASPVWALGLLALWLVCTAGLRPLMLPDEGRYASVALEMLNHGARVPTLDGLPFFHKPPLFYWLDMAAMQLLGTNQFAARAASLLGAGLMGLGLFLGLRRWHGQRCAAIALGVLATSPFFFVAAQFANLDMLVAGLITLAIFALLRALDEPPRLRLGWLVAGCVACALAMLAKGLIGPVLPALVIVPWLLVQGRWRQLLGLLHPLGVCVFAARAAPWFVMMQSRFPGFFDYFFVEQHFRRFAQTSFNNVSPFWFFIAVLPALTLPWSAWLPLALRRLWHERSARVGLYAWWVAAVVGFFSLPSSKIVGYVLPALAPLSVLLALTLAQPRWRAVLPWLMGGSAIVCVTIVVALGVWQQPRSNRAVALALTTRMVAGDHVVMVEEYFYDVPFYAGLTEPVMVVSDWADPELPMRDNGRKELMDAARFDVDRGRALLRPLSDLGTAPCGSGSAWYVIRRADARRLAGMQGATRVFADTRTELWRAPARRCP